MDRVMEAMEVTRCERRGADVRPSFKVAEHARSLGVII